MVVLDTCAIIEIAKPDVGLSDLTLKHIQQGAYILSVSFAEIACKIKLNKLDLGVSSAELYQGFKQVPVFEIIKIGVEEWLESINVDWPDNRDPADRLIVSFAIKHNIPIVTSDKKMNQFYSDVIW